MFTLHLQPQDRPRPQTPFRLQFKRAAVISVQECRRLLRNIKLDSLILDNVVCTLTPAGKGTCNGDSGGPLITDNGTVVGITSWVVRPCATDKPDAYASVYPHLSFIRQITGISG